MERILIQMVLEVFLGQTVVDAQKKCLSIFK